MKTIAYTYGPYMNRIMAMLAGFIALSIFLYGIFLLEAVAHTASRSTAEREIAMHTSELSKLQTQYLALTKNITLDRATELGLVVSARVTTIYATPQNALSLGAAQTIR